MSEHPFASLTPDRVLDAIEQVGMFSDARMLALNSYENRVYRVGIEDASPVVIKFYRPNRWDKECIQEELDYLDELHSEQLPVVQSLQINGQSLFYDGLFYFALFPLQGGRAPDFSVDKTLKRIGKQLAHYHNIGSQGKFKHRASVSIKTNVSQAMQTVLNSNLMPDDYKPLYKSLYQEIPALIDRITGNTSYCDIRIHGDLHQGNLLDDEHSIFMLDFDDCKNGPAMQDIWMLLHGSMEEQQQQLNIIQSGYEELAHFPLSQLILIEPLRTLRLVQHVAWLSERWSDPAFPIAFPWFKSHHFWSEHLMQLREQTACLAQPPSLFVNNQEYL